MDAVGGIRLRPVATDPTWSAPSPVTNRTASGGASEPTRPGRGSRLTHGPRTPNIWGLRPGASVWHGRCTLTNEEWQEIQ